MSRPFPVLAMSLMLLSGCAEGPEDAPTYLERAETRMAAGEVKLALIEARNATRLDPELVPALELQMQIFEEQRDLVAVSNVIRKILQYRPNHVAANLRRAELLLLSGDDESITENIDRVLRAEPNNTKALNLQIAELLVRGETLPAARLLDQLLRSEHSNGESFVLAASLEMQRQDFTRALEQIEAGLDRFPVHAPLSLMQIRVAHQQERLQDVPAIYNRVIEQNPETLAYRVQFAEHYLAQDAVAAAAQVMQATAAQFPKSVQAKLFLARIVSRADTDAAITLLGDMVAAEPELPQLRLMLASIYRDSQRFGDAAAAYEAIAEQFEGQSEALVARNALARQALQQHEYEDALAHLNEVLTVDAANPESQLLMAQTQLAQSNPKAAVLHLNVLLAESPESDRALVLLGQAHLADDQVALAQDAFRKALSLNSANSSAAKSLALIANQQRRFAQLEELLSPFEADAADDELILQLLLRARVQNRNWSGALRLAQQPDVRERLPQLAPWYRAMVASERGDPATAIGLLKQLVGQFPGSRQMSAGLVETYIRAGQLDDAITFLSNQLQSGEQHGYEFVDLARLQVRNQQVSLALATLEDGSNAFPDDVPLLVSFAALLDQVGDVQRAEKLYQHILKLAPETDVAANNLALIYAKQPKKLAQARSLAARFESSEQPFFLDTLGWICVLEDDLDCGLSVLKRAVELESDQAELQYHLGVAYQRAAQPEMAVLHFRRSARLVEAGSEFEDQEQLFAALETIGRRSNSVD
ncbi:MAG: tetratricopeptide repeat protein [Pseudomonadota bacterium]